MAPFRALGSLGITTLLLAGCSTVTETAPLPAGTPLLPSGTKVEVSLDLSTARVVVGDPINATVTMKNLTRRSITVEGCAADGWLHVGLENQVIKFSPGFLLMACAPTIKLAPGANVFSATISTSYSQCTSGSSVTASLPACTPRGGPPLLPAGYYKTKVVVVGLPAATVRAPRQVVTLRSPSS